MASMQEFDVLRLIEHGQTCYVSSDNVRGMQMVSWLKVHPDVDKETLFGWLQDIVRQLSQIHKCRGQPCYQYVNPYSLIVTEEKAIYFLDTGAGSNEELIRQMQRRPIREHFLPSEEPYYQRASEELDIYGLGKTIQFLLAETRPDPALRPGEEQKFQRIISRCLDIHSKKSFTQVSDILKYLPKYKQKERKLTARWIKEGDNRKLSRFLAPIAVSIILPVLIIAGILAYVNKDAEVDVPEAAELTRQAGEYFEAKEGELGKEAMKQIEAEEAEFKEEPADSENEENAVDVTETALLNMKLGTLYFQEFSEYAASREYFQAAGELTLAKDMAEICTYLSEDGEETEQTKIRETLQQAEESLQTLDIPDASDFYPCFLKAYLYLDASEDAEEILRLGKLCLPAVREEHKSWVLESMETAYENKGDFQNAAETCIDWLMAETDGRMREMIYERLAGSLEEAGQALQAREDLLEGIREFPDSKELRIQYLKLLCQDPSVGRDQCAEEISNCIQELPEIQEEQEFTKLLKENGMNVEGDKVWAER